MTQRRSPAREDERAEAAPPHDAMPESEAGGRASPGGPVSDDAAGGARGDDPAVAPQGEEAAGPADEGEGNEGLADAEARIEADLDSLARERDEYLDALRRLQADFENYRKRVLRQQTEQLERAAEELVAKMLPVLDAVDLARQHGAGEGVEQIASALLDVLGKEGLERVGAPGDEFDPNLHEAVAQDDSEGDPGVAEVLRAGWTWRGKLLRPAMVKVRG